MDINIIGNASNLYNLKTHEIGTIISNQRIEVLLPFMVHMKQLFNLQIKETISSPFDDFIINGKLKLQTKKLSSQIRIQNFSFGCMFFHGTCPFIICTHSISNITHQDQLKSKFYAQILHQYVIFSLMEESIFGLVMILI